MRKYALCAVLLLVLPASASISYVRSNPQWGGGSSSCAVSLTTTNANDMIVVWAEWQTAGGFPNTITVSSILDGTNTFRSAIGPTVQPTGNVAAQIFYAAKILAGGDTVTVSFSGTVASSACVIAEYSGADLLYPLDSVSAGYSYSLNPGTALDSGAAAPANPNFMVFGAGIVDVVGTPNTTSPFQIRQNTPNTSAVCGFVEDNVTPTAQTLQHAYASCTGSGDWLMQMAVFRSASWTVAGGWSPVRPYQVLDATQFPGTDPCAATKAAIETPVGGNNSPVVDSRGFISTAIPCANAPFSSSDTGWLDLPSGLIQNQNPWVFGNNGMWLHGTGRGSPSGTLGTIIEAQTAVSGSNTPVAIFQMSSGPEFANGADHLALDGNGLAGSMGIQDDFCQEECGFDYLKITNTTVAGADFGFGAGNVQHGVNLTNFEIITPLIGGNTNPSCGPGVNALAISGVSVDASGVVTATVSSTTGLYVRNEAVITGIPSGVTHATNFNGTYAITKVTSLTQFQYEINVTQSDSAGSGGVISTYNIPLRVWTVIGASLHAIRNGTITMGNCRATLPSGAYTAEFSGPSPIVVEGLHEEGAGIDIGGLGPTSNVDIESGDGQAGGATNHVVNDITISNQWGLRPTSSFAIAPEKGKWPAEILPRI